MSQLRQRFEGASIEDALAAAIDQYGPQVSVTEAKRLRAGGLLGFFAKERYEVTAAPGIDGGEARARLDDTLRGLVNAVESEAQPASFARVLAATIDPLPSPPSLLPAPTVSADTGAWISGLASFLERPESVVDISEGAVVNPLVDETVAEDPAPIAAVTVTSVTSAREQHMAGEPAWSRDGLRALGLPAAVLSRLPAEDPDTDLEWTAALGRAIAAVVPSPAHIGESSPIAVSGYGREAAILLVRAGADGFPPGTLFIDGSEVPATPTELALGVRACLPR